MTVAPLLRTHQSPVRLRIQLPLERWRASADFCRNVRRLPTGRVPGPFDPRTAGRRSPGRCTVLSARAGGFAGLARGGAPGRDAAIVARGGPPAQRRQRPASAAGAQAAPRGPPGCATRRRSGFAPDRTAGSCGSRPARSRAARRAEDQWSPCAVPAAPRPPCRRRFATAPRPAPRPDPGTRASVSCGRHRPSAHNETSPSPRPMRSRTPSPRRPRPTGRWSE